MQEEFKVRSSKIAVLGGTGKSGKFIVEELIRNGFQIKMLVRSAEKTPLLHPLVEVVMGSARNHTNIQRLLSDCNGVISALGPSMGETDTCSVVVKHVTMVMKQLNIKRYIEIAGLGLTVPGDKKRLTSRLISWGIQKFSPATVNDRRKGYDILSASNTEWTIIRCPSIELTEVRRELKVSLTDSPGFKVSAADLAGFIVSQLSKSDYLQKCPFVAS